MKQKIMIGADPELNINTKSTSLQNKYSFNDTGYPTEIGMYRLVEQFGYDGSSRCLEIRPKPETKVKDLVKNIGCIINKMSMLTGDLFYAGHFFNHPLGGHIHFSPHIPNISLFLKNANKMYSHMSALIDNEEDVKKRQSYGYGTNNKYQLSRRQNWGIEYRKPGSWLYSPEIAYYVLSGIYIAFLEAMNDVNFSEMPRKDLFPTIYEHIWHNNDLKDFCYLNNKYLVNPPNINWKLSINKNWKDF